jgi:hypothetical protein
MAVKTTHRKETLLSGRTILGLLFALLLIAGAAAVGVGIYNAGIAQGIAQSADGTTPAVVVPAYGWDGPGWGIGGLFFGILFFVFFLFLIGGLFRALTYRGRGWGAWAGPGGPGGPGRWGAGHDHSVEGFRGSPWEQRAREMHDEWHRQHDAGGGPASAGPTSGGSSGQPAS